MKHLDLFSGIGGFSLAAKWAGIETIAFAETNEFCSEVLAKHWPDVPNLGDIEKVNVTEHVDIITGGFPCQPFSIAGSKKGIKDERYLWPAYLRIIKQSKPSWVIAENVTGLVAMELDNIIADLEKENYETSVFVLPACAANAPHRRDRIWIIAYLNSFRSNEWKRDRQSRFLQKDEEWNMEKIYKEWSQFIPYAWETFTARDWFDYNSKSSRANNGISGKLDKDRIKALGNAIVPQVVYPIFKAIKLINNL